MRLDPQPRFPADSGQFERKLTELFRDAAQQVNAAADGQIVASNNARTSIPTTGTFAKGDFVRKSAPSVTGSGIVVGWLRITDGSSHTLNTDWVECVIPTVSFFPTASGAALRVRSAGEIAAQDDSLGVIEFYSSDASANSTGVFGRIGTYNEFPGSWDGTGARVDTYMAFFTSTDGALGERFRINSDGRIYGTALHNNANAVTGTTNQYIASGTYSPTLTAGSNIGSLVAEGFCWTRVGNVVSVAGHVTATPTTASTSSSFGISLPIASAFTAIADLAGTGKQITATNGESLGIYADSTNDRAEAGFFASNNTNSRYVLHFQYTVR